MSSASHYKIVYRFTLKPGAWDEFLSIQRTAHALYSKHVSYELDFLRSEVDPNEVIEIQTYRSHAEAKLTENLHEKEPALADLFQKFLRLLDPSKETIETTVGEAVRL